MNKNKAVVRLENVSKTYKTGKIEVSALKDIVLEIEEGEFTVLAGPSGSGKTTLLNIIGALDKPTSGRVFIGGVEITSLPKSQLADIRLNRLGFIFQTYNLIPVLTAYENIEFTLLLQKVPFEKRREIVLDLLDKVGLKDYADRRPPEMSGGQQQRVAIARSIATGPELVMADEPTANLDSKTGSEIMDLMRKLNQEKNVTFIFSTHDPMVMERAKRVVKLKDGCLE